MMDQKASISRGCLRLDRENARCMCSGGKLDVFDWLKDIPRTSTELDVVEIQFKNTRKGFYRNVNQLILTKGDIVAVEASPGHDIGVVTLIGELVQEQMRKQGVKMKDSAELKKVYRKAKPVDLDKWQEAIAGEHQIMLEAREIALGLKLNMKIGDVEFQGDKTKAIFYYIADERVDFRDLIKVLAERFKIRVEMRQIGARQEAGRIGGIGSCGRELCCSTWMINFKSVTTNAARLQELSLNPLKLAGQCGKLKCCLNYELDCYADARKNFPSANTQLKTKEGTLFCQKVDIFKQIMWFSSEENSSLNIVPLSVDVVKDIISQNKKGIKVDKVSGFQKPGKLQGGTPDFENVVGQDSLTRFDDPNTAAENKRRKARKRKKPRPFKKADPDSNSGNSNKNNDNNENS